MTCTTSPLHLLADAASTYDSRCSTPNSAVRELRPRKSKYHRLQTKSKLCHLTKELRKTRYAQACQVTTVDNSPVTPQQLRLLRIVYDYLTIYPPESWQIIMAVILRRSIAQIRNWFANHRQKNRGDAQQAHIDVGERLRLRPSAFALEDNWNDVVFDEFILMLHFFIQVARLD
ncbi:hypothetical protein C8F01DRAFT_974332 [Mycena amicta]|nr:hypothetical protein C8F01DRAFT_974332 [Mycena amicta]